MRSLFPLFFVFLVRTVFSFQVGVGIYDMTGPSVEINFMGYAVPSQRGTGIHQRLRSRAFVFADGAKRNVFVSVDGGMGSDLINLKVIDRLNAKYGTGVYTLENMAISGTHTHSGPAGFLQYVLFQMTSLGYVKETFDAWVDGITNSIIAAHDNLQDGRVMLAQGHLTGANINRSPTSYLLNPESERAEYPEGDTDKNMMLLKIVNKAGRDLGVLNWFAVHGTSMNNTNTLTSGDNRGYASYALEREINGADVPTGHGAFVAAFASTNLGDVSPNTMGAKCLDTGLPCDGTSSTCGGKCELCIAFGPGTNGDMTESTQIIGDKQFQHAKTLMAQATENVHGPIDARHSFIDMSKITVTRADGSTAKTCSPAMGYSFAAGTTDGPGMFNFAQGTTTDNPFWNKVRDFLSEPTQEEIDCQAPKPILLNTGDIEVPYQWDPKIVPIQILRVGNLFILAVPSEFTTMAGRRLRNAVKKIIADGNIVEKGQEVHVTIAGLSNTYSSYVVTYEEYQAQRYEAASCIFGPHALEAYIQEFSRIARDLVAGTPSVAGAPPPDLSDKQLQLIPEARFDRTAVGTKFGQVVAGKDVQASYKAGDVAAVTFHAANPRNNQRTQGSYLTVERVYTQTLKGNAVQLYRTVALDGDWSTKFSWRAGVEDPLDLGVSKQSIATLSWAIDASVEAGEYRICYHGDHKIAKKAAIVPFSGCSANFQVTV